LSPLPGTVAVLPALRAPLCADERLHETINVIVSQNPW